MKSFTSEYNIATYVIYNLNTKKSSSLNYQTNQDTLNVFAGFYFIVAYFKVGMRFTIYMKSFKIKHVTHTLLKL